MRSVQSVACSNLLGGEHAGDHATPRITQPRGGGLCVNCPAERRDGRPVTRECGCGNGHPVSGKLKVELVLQGKGGGPVEYRAALVGARVELIDVDLILMELEGGAYRHMHRRQVFEQRHRFEIVQYVLSMLRTEHRLLERAVTRATFCRRSSEAPCDGLKSGASDGVARGRRGELLPGERQRVLRARCEQ